MMDEMLDWFNKAIRKSYSIHRKKICIEVSLKKVASVQPDTLLKETLAQLFSWEFYDNFKNTFYVELLWLTAST